MTPKDMIEAVKALRRQADKHTAFETSCGNTFSMSVNCHYCGGHGFAVRAWLDHVISTMEMADGLVNTPSGRLFHALLKEDVAKREGATP